MDVLKKISESGIVPVVVIENAEDAVSTARALIAGGIDVMEITFRTSAAADAIKLVKENVPEMTVGAGTVITLEQCKTAVRLGASFIVSPGYDEELVSWCVEHKIPVVPGCVTPTEIMRALKHGIKVLKFIPANVYGGLGAVKALAGPFTGVKFIPTGGVNAENIREFMLSPSVYAVGGSWVCPKSDITAHNFDKITKLCRESRKALLGFELAHIGINFENDDESKAAVHGFEAAFGFVPKYGNPSNFAGDGIEAMKSRYLGENGHIAIKTNRIEAAVAELERKGFALDMESAKYKGDRLTAVYLRNEIGGFAIHLLQK